MKFARLVFSVAGVYGLIVLLPQYFFIKKTAMISHRLSRTQSTTTASLEWRLPGKSPSWFSQGILRAIGH